VSVDLMILRTSNIARNEKRTGLKREGKMGKSDQISPGKVPLRVRHAAYMWE
jgi:hypothetical protein